MEAVGSASGSEITVTAVVVDHDGGEMLGESLTSLFAQTHPGLEVILVDNGSTDGAAERARDVYGDRLVYLRNERNVGFAAANNQAIAKAQGEWIVLLNNDAVADPRLVEELLLTAEGQPKVGMLACRVLVRDEPHIFDSVGLLVYPDGVCRARGWEEKDLGQYDLVEEVLAPAGAAAAYRKATLDDAGLFDPTFFAYLEDLDLGLRAQLRGWKCLYVPSAVVHHRKSSTYGNYSKFKAYHVERNRILTAVKLLPRFLLVISPLFTLNRYLLQFYAARTHLGLSADFVKEYSWLELLWIVLRAYATALRRLPTLLRERKAIAGRRRISKKEWYRLFGRFKLDAIELALKF